MSSGGSSVSIHAGLFASERQLGMGVVAAHSQIVGLSSGFARLTGMIHHHDRGRVNIPRQERKVKRVNPRRSRSPRA